MRLNKCIILRPGMRPPKRISEDTHVREQTSPKFIKPKPCRAVGKPRKPKRAITPNLDWNKPSVHNISDPDRDRLKFLQVQHSNLTVADYCDNYDYYTQW
jgi:hypothetical protein